MEIREISRRFREKSSKKLEDFRQQETLAISHLLWTSIVMAGQKSVASSGRVGASVV